MVTDKRLKKIIFQIVDKIIIVLTPEEIKQRLEIGGQFIQEIIAKGEVLYAQ